LNSESELLFWITEKTSTSILGSYNLKKSNISSFVLSGGAIGHKS